MNDKISTGMSKSGVVALLILFLLIALVLLATQSSQITSNLIEVNVRALPWIGAR